MKIFLIWFISRCKWEANFPELQTVTNLAELPKFVRFNGVELRYSDLFAELFGEKRPIAARPIAEKCQSLVNYLKPLKMALNNSVLIHFVAVIKANDANCFSGSFQFINHVRELLSICDSSHGYRIEIGYFDSRMKEDSANVIASILKMDPIVRCSHAEIIFRLTQDFYVATRLPIELISDWLHRKCEAINGNSKSRLLQINLFAIRNSQEIYEYLKEVLKNFSHKSFVWILNNFDISSL